MLRTLILLIVIALAGCSAAPTTTPGTTPGDAGSSPAETDAPAAPTTDATDETDVPDATGSADPVGTGDPLLDATLVDVRTGESFTLGELAADAPVLVETMAIWCISCKGQQRQVSAAHEQATFHSVSIDVDPNERPGDHAEYSEREGFDWPFVLADAELAQMLVDRFNAAVLNPPSMPKILITADGSVELVGLNEQLSAEAIAALVGG
jgi:thiol-disulfide isomerase/thioredoxin